MLINLIHNLILAFYQILFREPNKFLSILFIKLEINK